MKFFKRPAVKSGNEDKNGGEKDCLCRELGLNIERVAEELGEASDLVVTYPLGDGRETLAALYIKGLVDRGVIGSLSLEIAQLKARPANEKSPAGFCGLKEYLAAFRSCREGKSYEEVFRQLLAGNIVFIAEEEESFFAIAADSDSGRAIEQPTTQTIVRGSKEAFTENIDKNVMMVRKKIRNKALRVEDLAAGSVTHTAIKLLYIQDLARPEVIAELKKRIAAIDYDGILESSNIVEFIKDDRYSIFPTIMNYERPDAVAAALLEGRVALITDGTPYALTAPAVFVEFIQVSEDYYHHFIVASVIRFIRYLALIFTILVPALFIAITSFQQEIIPTPLLISLAAQRENVPFPNFLQVLVLEITFETLREAGIRMPRGIGQAVSIVGALVLGQAAVEAGLISAAVVIVVAATAIASFAITNYEMGSAARILRFAFLLMAGVYGLYGVLMSFVVLTLHLCKLKSLTVPYLATIALNRRGVDKDAVFRFPLWKMRYRPGFTSQSDRPRTTGQRAVSPSQKEKPEAQ